MVLVDVLADTPACVRWAYPRVYEWAVRYLAWVWAAAYHGIDQPWLFRLLQPWRRRWNQAMARRFQSRVASERPQIALATHFLPADLLGAGRRAGWFAGRLIVVVTDLFPHRIWLTPEADAMAVGSPATKTLCRQRGIAEPRLFVTGIPIARRFQTVPSQADARRQLGVEPSRFTLLMTGGGMGVGPFHRVVQRLMQQDAERRGQLQALIVCGDNARLKRTLEDWQRHSPVPMQVYGFVDTMPLLMAASDVLITKAGGMTVMEALAVGLPMVLCGVIPGQESMNAVYAVEHGAAIRARHADEAVRLIQQLLDAPDRLQTMRRAAAALGKPRAAEALVEQLVVPYVTTPG